MNKITEVYLLDAPFNQSQNETILFNSASEQLQYMNSIIKHSFTNFSYQREEQNIRVPAYIENLYDSNYLMYKNENGKRFYCFITKFTYKNDAMTEISFKYDVLQTFMFNYTLKTCFVEREHVNSDEVGENTIDEGLAIGDTIMYDLNLNTGMNDLVYIIGTTWGTTLNDDLTNTEIYGTLRNNIYSGIQMMYYEASEVEQMKEMIKSIETKRKNAIQYIAVIPRFALSTSALDKPVVYASSSVASKEVTVNLIQTTINGYTPKNKKLFCYPYNSIILSNNSGQQNLLKVENFNNKDRITFIVKSTLRPNPTVKLIPKSYKNVFENYDESISFSDFPMCEYSNPAYLNWLNSGVLNIGVGMATTLGNVYAGNIGGTVTSALGTLNSIQNYSLKSDNVNGSMGSGNVALLCGRDFKCYQQQIKYDVARSIDEYFTRYGYKVDRIKVPNIRGRQNFNFVKTQNCNLQGAIPSPYKEEIQEIFNKGITFWHSTSNYGNYTVDNNIV